MSQSPWVVDVDESGFQAEVVEKSRELPVVIDFWAPWCGPCRKLGPLLEKFAEEAAGEFRLVKINVDDNQSIAAEFGVSGIPAVFAVRDAKVINQFVGLLPEEELREFVKNLKPTEAEALVKAATELETRDAQTAEQQYRAALKLEPSNEAANLGLARVLLQSDGKEDDVQEILRKCDSADAMQEVDRIRRVLTIRETPHSDTELRAAQVEANSKADSAEVLFKLGSILAARGKYTEALQQLILAAENDKKLAGGAIRELMVNIFHIIGNRSAEAEEYRDRLRSLLY